MDQMADRCDAADTLLDKEIELEPKDGGVSRRHFLKVAGLTGAGMATGLNSIVSAAPSKPELCFMSVNELARRIQHHEISPVEVTEAFLARIAEYNDLVKAFIYVDRDGALQQAREAEKEIRSGHYRGTLHGIPVAYKDIFDVRGLPTTAASKVLARNIAVQDSAVAARLRDAGTVCLGKLNLWEFASGSMEVFGDARNPWNTEMITGGSSAGSGAALGARPSNQLCGQIL